MKFSTMEWERGDEIGYGSFSTVNLAINKSNSPRFPKLMAVKSIDLSQSDMLLKEKSFLEDLDDCPNIIKCFGGESSFEKGEELYNLFLEYAVNGTLADKMNKQSDRRLPENLVRRYTKSVLEGLKYIHDNNIVHCDLKLQNILLNDDVAKIADFGLAKRAGEKRPENAGPELRGTPLYMSPETVAEGVQEAPSDVWALGCLVAEMFAGAPAWRRSTECGMFKLLIRIGVGDELPEIPEEFSSDGRDFLEKIFVKDPADRWTARMLLSHPFVTECDDGYLFTCEASIPSPSPRGPFDWIDYDDESVESIYSITNMPSQGFDNLFNIDSSTRISPARRLERLVTCQIPPDWSLWSSWINVR